MVNVSDLYTAMFGHSAQREATQRYQKPAFDAHKLVHRTWFTISLPTSNGDMLDVRVDASKAFYSIFDLPDFKFSKTHKNYTLSKGTRSRPRTFIELPKPGVLKKSPEYLEMVEQNRQWYEARDRAAKNMIEEGMASELEGVMPEYRRLLALKDDEVRSYFEGQGWTILEEVDFTNWRPQGWILTSRPDGYGHDCGTYANMDWEAKKIYITGWSSDD